MEEKRIIVDNPTGLPLASVDDYVLFQGDLKKPLTEDALTALKTSICDHRVFIGKAAAKFNGELLTEDGHQTLTALKSLRDDDGYVGSRVITYKEENGNMVEDGHIEYDDIMIPYQLIVPQGKNDVERKKDAARKIAIINSQYADINPATTFFTSIGFDANELSTLMTQVRLPELSFTNFGINFDHLNSGRGFVNTTRDEQSGVNFVDNPESERSNVFEPITDPTTSQDITTRADIEETKKKLKEQYGSDDNLVEVFCPHCAESFFIDPSKL